MYFLSIIKSNAEIKKEPHWLLIPRGQVRPKSLLDFFVSQYFKNEKGTLTLLKKVMDYSYLKN